MTRFLANLTRSGHKLGHFFLLGGIRRDKTTKKSKTLIRNSLHGSPNAGREISNWMPKRFAPKLRSSWKSVSGQIKPFLLPDIDPGNSLFRWGWRHEKFRRSSTWGWRRSTYENNVFEVKVVDSVAQETKVRNDDRFSITIMCGKKWKWVILWWKFVCFLLMHLLTWKVLLQCILVSILWHLGNWSDLDY